MEPLVTSPLLPVLDAHLLSLLRELPAAAWELPTLAPQWRVRDVALHLLDGNLRTLSLLRDGHAGPAPAAADYASLVGFLNELNADWVRAGQRLSPVVITEMLAYSGPAYCQYLASLDPVAPATFAVAWAGEETSANWFHVAREYTEKWHHQQQIREAVGAAPVLLTPALYQPFLETCLRAWPWHYRTVPAAPGTEVELTVSGPGEGTWTLRRLEKAWVLTRGAAQRPSATIWLEGTVAWRLFMKSLPQPEAHGYARLAGARELAAPLLTMLTVMA